MSVLPAAIGSYQIVGELGQGRRSVVYAAVRPEDQRPVALKVFRAASAPPNAVERLRAEARLAGRIDHPGVVRVFEAGLTPEGQPYLVMERLAGETLGHRLRTQSTIALLTSLRLGQQLAEALTAVHALGIVHRDVEPDNVMLIADPTAPDGERVKLCDFGFARQVPQVGAPEPKEDERDLVPIGVPVGTALYMSAEHWRDARTADDRADVYSVGVILHYLLAGKPPFTGPNDAELMALHILAEPPDLAREHPWLPTELTALVRRMLGKKAAARPAMAQVAEALAELVQNELSPRHILAPARPAPPPAVQPAPPSAPPAEPPELFTAGLSSQPERVELPPLVNAPDLPPLPVLTPRSRFSMEEAERDAGLVAEPYLPWVLKAYPGARRGLPLAILLILLALAALLWGRLGHS